MKTTVNSRQVLSRFHVFELLSENITLSNGVTTDIQYLLHPGAAAIIPFVEPDRIIMIRQYRHAVGGFIWEIPAGTRNPEETTLACAQRELVEETGFSAETWHPLGTITPVPAYSDERIDIFMATDLSPASQNLDADEVLDVHQVPFSEALDMVNQGKIQDAKTISSLFFADQWLKR